MTKRVPKHFEIEIVPLTDRYLEETAQIHKICFPEKIESLLGLNCIVDVYCERYLSPRADSHCQLAIHKPDGRVAAFVYASETGPSGPYAHAFIHPHVLRRHLVRRVAVSPAVWVYILKRFARKLFVPENSESSKMPLTPKTCIAKMLGVHPDFRYGNVGVDLMRAVEVDARRRGAAELIGLIERSNIKAERLYESLGWVRTSPNDTQYRVFGMHKLLVDNP